MLKLVTFAAGTAAALREGTVVGVVWGGVYAGTCVACRGGLAVADGVTVLCGALHPERRKAAAQATIRPRLKLSPKLTFVGEPYQGGGSRRQISALRVHAVVPPQSSVCGP